MAPSPPSAASTPANTPKREYRSTITLRNRPPSDSPPPVWPVPGTLRRNRPARTSSYWASSVVRRNENGVSGCSRRPIRYVVVLSAVPR